MTLNVEHRTLTRNVLARFRKASPEHIESGLAWFDAAFTEAERLAWQSGRTIPQAAAVIAHLSPRVKWADNLRLAELLVHCEPRPLWALQRSWTLATLALQSEDPLSTFGPRARKTLSFAKAILGDKQAVVVDIWSARAAGYPENAVRTRQGYHDVSEAYRRGARVVGIPPRDLQACVWVSIRGEAA